MKELLNVCETREITDKEYHDVKKVLTKCMVLGGDYSDIKTVAKILQAIGVSFNGDVLGIDCAYGGLYVDVTGNDVVENLDDIVYLLEFSTGYKILLINKLHYLVFEFSKKYNKCDFNVTHLEQDSFCVENNNDRVLNRVFKNPSEIWVNFTTDKPYYFLDVSRYNAEGFKKSFYSSSVDSILGHMKDMHKTRRLLKKTKKAWLKTYAK